MKTGDWLKETDAVVIECEEDEISPHTIVLVRPFNTKTQEFLVNKGKEMTLQESLKIDKRQIVKGAQRPQRLQGSAGCPDDGVRQPHPTPR